MDSKYGLQLVIKWFKFEYDVTSS